MRFAAWYAIIVGLLMFGEWAVFIATGQVPELATEPLRITFHLAGEFTTALGLVVGGIAMLKRWSWAASVTLVASGMLLYTVIVSPGYFAQLGQWVFVAMFAGLLALTLVSIAKVMGSGRV